MIDVVKMSQAEKDKELFGVVERGVAGAFKELIKQGADTTYTQDGNNLFHAVAKSCNPEILSGLIESLKEKGQNDQQIKEMINAQGNSGESPLHIAAAQGMLAVDRVEPQGRAKFFKELVQAGADFSAKYNGDTALVIAIKNQAPETAIILSNLVTDRCDQLQAENAKGLHDDKGSWSKAVGGRNGVPKKVLSLV